MDRNILHPSVVAMLKDMEAVFSIFNLEYYLVGAIARDIQLFSNIEATPARKTKDVDVAVMIQDEEQFYAMKDALIATGDFQAHPTEAIKLIYMNSIELDLLPFGEIESEASHFTGTILYDDFDPIKDYSVSSEIRQNSSRSDGNILRLL